MEIIVVIHGQVRRSVYGPEALWIIHENYLVPDAE